MTKKGRRNSAGKGRPEKRHSSLKTKERRDKMNGGSRRDEDSEVNTERGER